MKRRITVLALVQKRLDLSPGQRYRIEQWTPHLRRDHGIDVDFAIFESPELSDVIYQPGRRATKAALLLRDFWRRRSIVRQASSFDAVFVYREAALLGPAIYERLVARTRTPIVYDFDDAVWLDQPSGPNGPFAKLRFPAKTETICRLAAGVSVGNRYLAEYARRFCRDVEVVPTTVDLGKYPVAAPLVDDEPFVIVWTGSHSTLAHLETARGAIERLGRRRPVRLRVICDRPPAPFRHVENEFVRWQSATEAADVAAAHVGIMPVPDDEFTRGKCGLKGLLYMACGRPAIMSPVGVNRDIVRPGENGLLASTEDEWVTALDQLASSRELRARMGAEARRTVEGHYAAERGAARLASLLRRATRTGWEGDTTAGPI